MSVGLHTWATGFAVRQGDGPIVNVSRQGDRWQLSWKGGSALLAKDEEDARKKAEIAARLLAEIEPLRHQYEELLADLGREVKGDEGDDPF